MIFWSSSITNTVDQNSSLSTSPTRLFLVAGTGTKEPRLGTIMRHTAQTLYCKSQYLLTDPCPQPQLVSEDVAIFEGNGIRGEYIALSHCLGAVPPLKTTKSNIDAHKSRIDWTSLPVLFRHANAVARDLGIQYL